MSGSKKLLFIFLAIISVLVSVLPFLPIPEEPITFLVFLGRFHPLLLHFPIVLVLLTLLFEGLAVYQGKYGVGMSKFSALSSLVGPMLIISVISTLVTVFGGYLLFQSGEYQGILVQRHFWGGILLMLSLNGAAFFFWQAQSNKTRGKVVYRIFLSLAGGLVLVTSHFGGSLTHGQDFLTEHMPTFRTLAAAPIESKDPQDLLVFDDLILPILRDKCESCHNQYKTKGGLVLTSYAHLLKGGDSEKPLLTAQDPSASELFHRITLPDSDEDKMPPPEKQPIDPHEITLIKWWILSGADNEMTLGADPPDSISLLISAYLPKLYHSERLKQQQQQELGALEEELSEIGQELGLIIELDPENPGFFSASMQIPPANVTNQTVSKLKPYASLFSKLSLPGADIDDDALFDIGKMVNLRDLYLPRTCVKGHGLIYLQQLDLLENINLSNSHLTNEGILNLVHLPDLKSIYVWGAQTDTLVLQTLRAHLPEVQILEEEGAYF